MRQLSQIARPPGGQGHTRGVRIRPLDLWRVVCRSFFIQSSWNYRGMIGLGFCFCLLPIAKRLCSDKDSLSLFLKRHLQFFNAHPVFVNWALGAVARIEEQAMRENWRDDRPIRVFKKRLCGPLGAIGDRLIWNLAKPLAAIIGLILAMTIGLLAIPIFLAVYNVPLIIYRLQAIRKAYRLGFDIVREMSLRRYAHQERLLATAGLTATGALFVAIGANSEFLISSLVAFAAGLLLFRLRARPAVVLLLGLLLTLVLGWLNQMLS